MDHHALMCTLTPPTNYQRGGRTRTLSRTRTLPKPTQQPRTTTLPDVIGEVGDVQTRNQSRTLYISYPQAGWEVPILQGGDIPALLQIVGQIKIDGQISNNPNPIKTDLNGDGVWDVIPEHVEPGNYPLPVVVGAHSSPDDFTGNIGAGNLNGDEFFPNYTKINGETDGQSGFGDAIAVTYGDYNRLHGWDYINNQYLLGVDYSNPIWVNVAKKFGYPLNDGAILPAYGILIEYAYRTSNVFDMEDFGNLMSPGEKFDDLLLYRAETRTYHRPTEDTKREILDSINIAPTPLQTVIYTEPYASLFFGSEPVYQSTQFSIVSSHPGKYFEFGPAITDSDELGDTIVAGDVNDDAQLNILDVVLLVNMILNPMLSQEVIYNSFPQADMNGDGAIDVIDVVNMIQFILNNPATPPRDRKELQTQLNRLIK
tara:strand:- start:247 stop:1527 length:1281 start_codon:yes stop_codon:yes gene_type:complete